MKKIWVAFFVGCALVFIVFGGSFWNAWKIHRAGPEAFGRVPDFSFPAATANGPTSLSSQDLTGKVWLADFIFTYCSGPCPRMTSLMSGFQKSLPPSVRFVSFTVDPDRDDLPTLADYARQFEADPARWWFVRADKAALYKLVLEGFKLPMMEDPSAESGARVIHSQKFVLVDTEGRIRGYFDSNEEGFQNKLLRSIQEVSPQ